MISVLLITNISKRLHKILRREICNSRRMLEKYQRLFRKCFTFVKAPSNGREFKLHLTDVYRELNSRLVHRSRDILHIIILFLSIDTHT